MTGHLTMEQAKHMLNRDACIRVIDLRSPEEYHRGHIPGSINVPMEDIEYIESIVRDKCAPIFLYCQSGKHSMSVRTVLLYLGYEKVWNIGSIRDWSGKLVR